jgi:ATP-binding cassette subfamily B protein
MRDPGLPRLVGLFALSYALDYALFVLSWWLLGRGVLESPIDFRFLYAWALVLASMLPFRMLSTWSAGAIAVSAGELLKKRLLQGRCGLTRRASRRRRRKKSARVFESESVETLF